MKTCTLEKSQKIFDNNNKFTNIWGWFGTDWIDFVVVTINQIFVDAFHMKVTAVMIMKKSQVNRANDRSAGP